MIVVDVFLFDQFLFFLVSVDALLLFDTFYQAPASQPHH